MRLDPWENHAGVHPLAMVLGRLLAPLHAGARLTPAQVRCLEAAYAAFERSGSRFN